MVTVTFTDEVCRMLTKSERKANKKKRTAKAYCKRKRYASFSALAGTTISIKFEADNGVEKI